MEEIESRLWPNKITDTFLEQYPGEEWPRAEPSPAMSELLSLLCGENPSSLETNKLAEHEDLMIHLTNIRELRVKELVMRDSIWAASMAPAFVWSNSVEDLRLHILHYVDDLGIGGETYSLDYTAPDVYVWPGFALGMASALSVPDGALFERGLPSTLVQAPTLPSVASPSHLSRFRPYPLTVPSAVIVKPGQAPLSWIRNLAKRVQAANEEAANEEQLQQFRDRMQREGRAVQGPSRIRIPLSVLGGALLGLGLRGALGGCEPYVIELLQDPSGEMLLRSLLGQTEHAAEEPEQNPDSAQTKEAQRDASSSVADANVQAALLALGIWVVGHGAGIGASPAAAISAYVAAASYPRPSLAITPGQGFAGLVGLGLRFAGTGSEYTQSLLMRELTAWPGWACSGPERISGTVPGLSSTPDPLAGAPERLLQALGVGVQPQFPCESLDDNRIQQDVEMALSETPQLHPMAATRLLHCQEHTLAAGISLGLTISGTSDGVITQLLELLDQFSIGAALSGPSAEGVGRVLPPTLTSGQWMAASLAAGSNSDMIGQREAVLAALAVGLARSDAPQVADALLTPNPIDPSSALTAYAYHLIVAEPLELQYSQVDIDLAVEAEAGHDSHVFGASLAEFLKLVVPQEPLAALSQQRYPLKDELSLCVLGHMVGALLAHAVLAASTCEPRLTAVALALSDTLLTQMEMSPSYLREFSIGDTDLIAQMGLLPFYAGCSLMALSALTAGWAAPRVLSLLRRAHALCNIGTVYVPLSDAQKAQNLPPPQNLSTGAEFHSFVSAAASISALGGTCSTVLDTTNRLALQCLVIALFPSSHIPQILRSFIIAATNHSYLSSPADGAELTVGITRQVTPALIAGTRTPIYRGTGFRGATRIRLPAPGPRPYQGTMLEVSAPGCMSLKILSLDLWDRIKKGPVAIRFAPGRQLWGLTVDKERYLQADDDVVQVISHAQSVSALSEALSVVRGGVSRVIDAVRLDVADIEIPAELINLADSLQSFAQSCWANSAALHSYPGFIEKLDELTWEKIQFSIGTLLPAVHTTTTAGLLARPSPQKSSFTRMTEEKKLVLDYDTDWFPRIRTEERALGQVDPNDAFNFAQILRNDLHYIPARSCFGQRSWNANRTWGQFSYKPYFSAVQTIYELTEALRDIGVVKGSHIFLVVSFPRPEAVEMAAAAGLLGAILCPIFPRSPVPQLRAMFTAVEPDFVLIDPSATAIYANNIAPLLKGKPVVILADEVFADRALLLQHAKQLTPEHTTSLYVPEKAAAGLQKSFPDITEPEKAAKRDLAPIMGMIVEHCYADEQTQRAEPTSIAQLGDRNMDELLGSFDYGFCALCERGRTLLAAQGDWHVDPAKLPDCDYDAPYAIVFTSGTTGVPKGALLTQHSLFLSSIILTERCVPPSIHTHGWSTYFYAEPEKADEVPARRFFRMHHTQVAFLPMSHVFGLMLNIRTLQLGETVCFVSKGVDQLVQDLAIARPTMLQAVPRVLARVHAAVEGSMAHSILNRTYKHALQTKWERVRRAGAEESLKLRPAWYDRTIFRIIRNKFGGRVDVIFTGSAALSEQLGSWCRSVFSPIVEGYGATETSSGCICTPHETIDFGNIGPPCAFHKVRLVSVPEMGYSVSNSIESGQCAGELQIKGPCLFQGYYNDPEATKLVMTEDGYYRTGDICCYQRISSGHVVIRIIDRLSAQVKLAQGEFVAIGQVSEQLSDALPRFSTVTLLHRSDQSFLIAIALADAEQYSQLGMKSSAVDVYSAEHILEASQLVFEAGRKLGLRGFEIPLVTVVLPTGKDAEWTADNGMLTSALKTCQTAVKTRGAPVALKIFEAANALGFEYKTHEDSEKARTLATRLSELFMKEPPHLAFAAHQTAEQQNLLMEEVVADFYRLPDYYTTTNSLSKRVVLLVPGETVLAELPDVTNQTCRNGNDSAGIIQLTQLRIIWRSRRRERVNVHIGLHVILSVNDYPVSDSVEICSLNNIDSTESRGRVRTVFSRRGPPGQLLSIVRRLLDVYNQTILAHQFRLRTRLTGASGQLSLLPKERPVMKVSPTFTLSAQGRLRGIIVLTTHRFMWLLESAPSLSSSMPWVCIEGIGRLKGNMNIYGRTRMQFISDMRTDSVSFALNYGVQHLAAADDKARDSGRDAVLSSRIFALGIRPELGHWWQVFELNEDQSDTMWDNASKLLTINQNDPDWGFTSADLGFLPTSVYTPLPTTFEEDIPVITTLEHSCEKDSAVLFDQDLGLAVQRLSGGLSYASVFSLSVQVQFQIRHISSRAAPSIRLLSGAMSGCGPVSSTLMQFLIAEITRSVMEKDATVIQKQLSRLGFSVGTRCAERDFISATEATDIPSQKHIQLVSGGSYSNDYASALLVVQYIYRHLMNYDQKSETRGNSVHLNKCQPEGDTPIFRLRDDNGSLFLFVDGPQNSALRLGQMSFFGGLIQGILSALGHSAQVISTWKMGEPQHAEWVIKIAKQEQL